MLGREKFTTRLARVGGVVGNQEFVGIAKQVDVAIFKITKFQPGHAFEHGGQTGVFVDHRVAEAVAGGVEIGKQLFDGLDRPLEAGADLQNGQGRIIMILLQLSSSQGLAECELAVAKALGQMMREAKARDILIEVVEHLSGSHAGT